MFYFIVNPAAGNGKAMAAVPIISRVMREGGAAHAFIYTSAPDDFARVSAMVDYGAAKAIACVGGDGTVQEYVGLAVGRDVDFAVIPAGCGNDFIYSMPGGGRKFGSFEEKIAYYTRAAVNGATIRADAVEVRGACAGAGSTGSAREPGATGAACPKYFFNIGGAGIDVNVLKDSIPLKRRFGGASYFISLVKNVATYKPTEITLTVDGKAEKSDYLLMAVCNGAYYGGHLRIAPPAAIDDGKLTLCRISNMPRIKLVAVFPLVKPGRHVGFKEVLFTDCSSVKLEFNGRRTINLDGNLCDFESPLSFEIAKSAVRLVVCP